MSCSRPVGLATTLMDASSRRTLCAGTDLHRYASWERRSPELSHAHRTIILRAMETIVKNSLTVLTKETAKMVILLASNEMTKSKDIIFEWQQAASNVLVAVGRNFINTVMEEILVKFQPGILPHFFIIQTLANLSMANVMFGMVPFLNSILGPMLPMLGMAKQDPMKAVFCVALQHFSESIQEYLANLDKAPDPTVRKDTFSMRSSVPTIFCLTLGCRTVSPSSGPDGTICCRTRSWRANPSPDPGILSLYKKNVETFYVTKVITAPLRHQICSSLDLLRQMLLRNQNEVLRCFTGWVRFLPGGVFSSTFHTLHINTWFNPLGQEILGQKREKSDGRHSTNCRHIRAGSMGLGKELVIILLQ
ncbi:hypothetical protein GDO86_015646 [Hymenochirus boettgeri]|uniref:MROH2B-like N-terminal HEAT-repeats domain-containing protein n=1 Tax=Hymenochirus boettgeri TaxID=247094 RepID=A0A8T2K1V9_9PIPI|nr:hypothetical protein GDO86_015646 [Hymenochirus boettgeri]